jgi:transcriptional antiterminator RfaH
MHQACTLTSMQHWHLLMTKPREDERAEAHLLNQGYEIFRPLLKKYRIRGGKQVAAIEPLFPRYIFIRLDDVLSNWAKIRSTRGVSGLVRFTEMPAKVPSDLVELLKGQCDEGCIVDLTGKEPHVFRRGDGVEITAGSFRGIQAIIKEQKGEDRVVLLLNLMGQEHAMEMPIHQVKPS